MNIGSSVNKPGPPSVQQTFIGNIYYSVFRRMPGTGITIRLGLCSRKHIVIEICEECFGNSEEGRDEFYQEWLEEDTEQSSHLTRPYKIS